MNKYEPCMIKMLVDKKEQRYVLPENAKFGSVLIINYLGNVGCRIA